MESFFLLAPSPPMLPSHTVKTMKWLKPPVGWVKLNTDGALSQNLGVAGAGDLIQDCDGNWIRGFSRAIGVVLSFLAELWALRDGLSMVRELGIQKLVVEMDAKEALNSVTNTSHANLLTQAILMDCRTILQSF